MPGDTVSRVSDQPDVPPSSRPAVPPEPPVEVPDGGAADPAAAPTSTPTSIGVPPTRDQRVAAAVSGWSAELGDLGGPDTLLWFTDLPVGTLDITGAHPSGLAMLLAGRPTRLSGLVRETAALADARRRARAIRAKTLELAEERGLAAGWLAVGMATWDVPAARRSPAAPVLLRACTLRPRDASAEDFDVDLGAETRLNPVLVHHLATEHGIDLDADAVADLAVQHDRFDPTPVLARVREACAALPGLTIEPRLVISTFTDVRPAMVDDLAQAEGLAGHDVVAALAGDAEALTAVGRRAAAAPDVERAGGRLVLDADSSQEAVVAAVMAGSHLVVEGPPGTGTSQTIANLVAALSAAGRRTLLVTQKRAAIDAVLQRLDGVGLGDLVLDLPDGGAGRRRVARELATTLDRAGQVARPGTGDLDAELGDRRAQLQAHARALHEVRRPWAVTAHAAQSALVDLTARRPAPRSRVRVRGEALERLDAEALERLRGQLREAATLGALRAGPDDDPWFGARLVTADETERALAAVTELTRRSLAQARRRMDATLTELGMPAGTTVASWGRTLSLVGAVRESLEVFSPQVFEGWLPDAVAATAPARWRQEHGVSTSWWHRRRLHRQARATLRPGTPPSDLHAALAAADTQRRQWQEAAGPGSRPALPSGLDDTERAYLDVAEPLGWLAERLAGTVAGGDLAGADLDVLAARLHLLGERVQSLPLVPHAVVLGDRLRAAGLEPLLADLAERGVGPDEVGAELDLVWWTSLLEHVGQVDPAYGVHDGSSLREVAAEYADADRRHVGAGAAAVRRAVAERLVGALDEHPEQAALLREEAARTRRHRPLRELVRSCPDLLAAAKPCWAMSPLVVPLVLPPGEQFDVVVVDEASQLRPAEAVPAISRARQVVVAGDARQLPPSAFVTSAGDDAGDAPAGEHAAGESVLDALSVALPVARLRWHYRSRDERLIAFADDHVYDRSLVTFPGTVGDDVVHLVEVDGSGPVPEGVDGTEVVESTDAEVAAVVRLVVEHAWARPHESLGVVTLGLRHAARVQEALRRELATRPEVAGFFSDTAPERFFVKSVERVQGDERDAVVLSIGFGRTPHGRVLHRFGPLDGAGGERLLNVAVTRSRRRMTVVSSFGPDDLDPARLTTPGARLLRHLLAYAASGGSVPAASASGAVPQSASHPREPLLDDLADRLRAAGLAVHQRHGTSSAPIDLAVGEDGGALRLAVESDGASYAAVPTTRERDRLRIDQLERLGWTHLRIWSTDVFRDPAQEVARVRAAVRQQRPTPVPVAPQVTWDTHEGPPDAVSGAVGGAVAGAASTGSAPPAAGRRGERPRVPMGQPIDSYTAEQLDQVVAWICSDTLLRTREEITSLARQQLGLTRRGARVDAVLGAAVERTAGSVS